MKTNLKPFDLQAALKGEPVMLRNGSKAYLRHHETELTAPSDSKLLGYRSDGSFVRWHENGYFYDGSMGESLDIIGMYPRNRIINGFEVPAPETETPAIGSTYFVVHILYQKFYDGYRWNGYEFDKLWLERGLVFKYEEDAIANSKAMLGIDPYEGDVE